MLVAGDSPFLVIIAPPLGQERTKRLLLGVEAEHELMEPEAE